MRSTCPKVADTRWLSMENCCKWFTIHITDLQQYFNTKQPQCNPTKSWWVFLFAVHAFAREASAVAVALQGATTLVSEQRASFEALISKYCNMINMEELRNRELDVLDLFSHEVCRPFGLRHIRALSFLNKLNAWVVEQLQQLEVTDVHDLVIAVAKLFVKVQAEYTKL